MSARTEVTSHSTSSPTPRISTPRNGGTTSNTMRTHRGSRARWRSLTSPSAMTTSNAPSPQRNQTGETFALPSFRYVVSTAGEGASTSERTRSSQSPVTPATYRRSCARPKRARIHGATARAYPPRTRVSTRPRLALPPESLAMRLARATRAVGIMASLRPGGRLVGDVLWRPLLQPTPRNRTIREERRPGALAGADPDAPDRAVGQAFGWYRAPYVDDDPRGKHGPSDGSRRRRPSGVDDAPG
jgi:hypothetical protein